MKERIVIIGGKSSAMIIADNIENARSQYNMPIEVLGFANDDKDIGEEIIGYPVISNVKDAYKNFGKHKDVKFVYQQYDIKNMVKAIANKDALGIPDEKYLTFVHPSSVVARSATVGAGTIILSHCVVNTLAQLGSFNSIMTHVTIGHDARVGNYNLVATHAIISNLIMGDRNFIGINVATMNKISIGNDCMVGMCSNLTKSIKDNVVCYGNPAKPVSSGKNLR